VITQTFHDSIKHSRKKKELQSNIHVYIAYL